MEPMNPADVTDELILRRCRRLRDALKLCRDCSPLDDKEIIHLIKIRTGYEFQKSHFSECVNGIGNRNFPLDLIAVLEDICGNLIPTRYMALARNCELRTRKQALEIENEQLRAELAEAKKEMQVITKFLRESGVRT